MSDLAPPRPAKPQSRHRFAIVASEFNREFVDALVDHASAELRTLAPESPVEIHRVPGAFEIPVVVSELALDESISAVLALAVIIRGHTPHAEHLARSVTEGLQHIATTQRVPVINAVLGVENEEQARERCCGERINRGTEAARAAVQIAGVMAKLRSNG